MALPLSILGFVDGFDLDKTELAIIGLTALGITYVGGCILGHQALDTTLVLLIVTSIVTGGALGVGSSLGTLKAQNGNGKGE